MSCNPARPSHSSSPSDSSNASASTSISREVLAAQYGSTIQQISSRYLPQSTCHGRDVRHSLQSPRTGRSKKTSRQIIRSPTSNTGNVPSHSRLAPRPETNSVRAPYRALDSSLENTAWRSWHELRIKIFNIPPSTTTRDLDVWFSKEGRIHSIEIYENHAGSRDGNACVSFRPPPARPFWENVPYALQNEDQQVGVCQLGKPERSKTFTHPSPVRPNVRYPEMMEITVESLDFGVMLDNNAMMGMKRLSSTARNPITLRQNMNHKELSLEFMIPIRDRRSIKPGELVPDFGRKNRDETFRFSIPFSRLGMIRQSPEGTDSIALCIMQTTPPKFFKRVDSLRSHDERSRIWKEDDAWYRQTDVVYDPAALGEESLSLSKIDAVIDFGRWTTYRLILNLTENDMQVFGKMKSALHDYNVEVVSCPHLQLLNGSRPAVWKYIDRPYQEDNKAGSVLKELIADDVYHLCFQVRYQLEVCISQGYLSEYNLSSEFVKTLANMDTTTARDLLEGVANQGKPVYRPMSLLGQAIKASSSAVRLPDYCTLIRSATVTPTTVHFHTPAVETSNRVIRQHIDHSDRFLRVRFTDEKSEGRIHSSNKDQLDDLFARISRVLTHGICIGDRNYEFLAFGNSQLRENGAYFFAPTFNIDSRRIRMWMGNFRKIKTVAKYASRLGQCFSTTRAITNVLPDIKEIEDITHNGFCFTDGVGKISSFLAQLAASEIGILHANQETPSVFQFRSGGAKGVLAVSPESTARELHLRFSQYKFDASHERLDVIRWSQYACAKLNRQIILILSALGVPDDPFKQKLQLQLFDLRHAMTNEKKALNLLQKYVDHNQMTLTLAAMVIDGFQSSGEPFTLSLLHLWRAWSVKYLKEKAQIAVNGGALLLGCVDETNTLRGHYDEIHDKLPGPDASIEERTRQLPQIFVQLSRDPDSTGNPKPKVILGPMLLARNPSLHPGDIRVVCGVDIPQLHHLKDAVVLPQNGDRDIASMCSGGDLDGDDYLVIWDRDLLPAEWNHEPMDYSAPLPLVHKGKINVDDLTTFFVTYMKNDSLGRIAVAHLAWADYLDEGVKADKCLQLAQLHSKAVDYAKTGQPAHMTPDLYPRKWPHFMEKTHLRKDKTYVSQKILGQLYDQVERVDFAPVYLAPYDQRIMRAYDLSDSMLATAGLLKQSYDAAIRRIMAQLDINTEFEVFSTFVLSHNKPSDFKFHEEIGQLSLSLKHQYRDLCIEAAGGKEHDDLGPFAAAMYRVTAEEMARAVEECGQTHIVDGKRTSLRKMEPASMPLMSFPWIFHDVLGKIAKPIAPTFTPQSSNQDAKNPLFNSGQPPKLRNSDNGVTVLSRLEIVQGIARQSDLFRPLSLQHMKDLENAREGDVARSTNVESQSDLVSDNAKEVTIRIRGRQAAGRLLEAFTEDSTVADE